MSPKTKGWIGMWIFSERLHDVEKDNSTAGDFFYLQRTLVSFRFSIYLLIRIVGNKARVDDNSKRPVEVGIHRNKNELLLKNINLLLRGPR